MRHLILLALLLAGSAAAQDTTVVSQAQTAVDTSSGAAAAVSGNQINPTINLINKTPDKQVIKYEGKVGNTPVALTAATSFSSDYCGGTDSIGGSFAGATAALSKVTFDQHCQHLRASEKWGLVATSLNNMGYREARDSAVSMMLYELCTANAQSQESCVQMGLVRRADKKAEAAPITFKTWPKTDTTAVAATP